MLPQNMNKEEKEQQKGQEHCKIHKQERQQQRKPSTSMTDSGKLQLLTAVILCLFHCTIVTGDILAYDCAHPMSNRTKINMLSSAPCVFNHDEESVETKQIYLIQPKEFFRVHVKHCKISVIRDINDCSTFSDNKVLGGFLSYIQETSYEECSNMHRFLSTRFGETFIQGLKPNSSVSNSVILAGKLYHHNGGCKGGSWSDGTNKWDDVYVVASVTISLRDYWAQAETDGLTLKLESGYSCKTSERQCVDPENGYTIWEDLKSRQSCESENYELIYKGPANKTTIKTEEGPSTLFSVSNEIAFSLLIRGNSHVCGHKAFQTEHPKLKIIEHSGIDFDFKKSDDSFNLNLFTYINSKFTYLERHTKTQLTQLHKAMLINQCELDKSILNTQLALAFLSPSDFAYLRMGKPGYTALPAGEVMYLVKCQAVPVKRKFVDKCYQEFPVEYKNSTWYMAPRTHILMVKGNEIPCSEIVPVNYNIENKWYSFSPKIHESIEPTSVIPKSDSSWKYSEPVPLINTGLYSYDDLESMRHQILFPMNKGAALNAVANKITSTNQKENSNDEFNYSNLISDNVIEGKVSGLLAKTQGFLSTIGLYSSAFIGIWAAIKVFKWLADFVFHITHLYREFGLSVHMYAAVWDTLSNHLVTNSKLRKTKEELLKVDPSGYGEASVNLGRFKQNSLKDYKTNEIRALENETEDKLSKTEKPSESMSADYPHLHYRVHYKPRNSNENSEMFMCVNEVDKVTPFGNGFTIMDEGVNIEKVNFKLNNVFICTCRNRKYEERKTIENLKKYQSDMMVGETPQPVYFPN